MTDQAGRFSDLSVAEQRADVTAHLADAKALPDDDWRKPMLVSISETLLGLIDVMETEDWPDDRAHRQASAARRQAVIETIHRHRAERPRSGLLNRLRMRFRR